MLINKLTQPKGQDRNLFNNLKRLLKNIDKLSDEQLALLHYESWHQAYVRSGGAVEIQ